MSLTLPTAAEQTLRKAWGDQFDQKGFEALLLEGYREKALSVGRIAELLGLPTSHEADAWLAVRGIERNYDSTDFTQDCDSLASVRLPRRPQGRAE